jgi:hypothetical protein
MGELLKRIGPISVVAIVFTWCCWPYITGSATATGSKEPEEVSGLPKGLLSPAVAPPNPRDPFKTDQAASQKLPNGRRPGSAGGAPDADNPGARAAADANADRQDTLVLSGTYIQGNRRRAILGGKVYETGEALDQPDPGKKPWVVKEVLLDRVVLQRGGDTTVITYPQQAGSRAASHRANQSGRGKQKNEASEKHSPKTRLKDGPKPVTTLSELVQAVEASQKP